MILRIPNMKPEHRLPIGEVLREPLITRNGGAVELLSRAATIEPSTFDAEKNTVQVTFSTGSDFQRSDWEGPFIERLDLTADAVNLAELRGAPVLNNHDRFSGVEAILGVVEDATVDGKRGVATLRLSGRPEVAGLVQDIKAGIIRNVSAGYTVQTWRVEKRADGMRIKTAAKWTPKEASFVPIGADPAAKTRSQEQSMLNPNAETIRSIATAVGVTAGFADDLINRNVTLDESRAAIIREAARNVPEINNRQDVRTRDNEQPLYVRMADGLRAQVNPAHRPEIGREFANMRIFEMARHCLQARGESTLGAPAELITRAMMTTSDFSAIFVESFNKELLTLRTNPVDVAQLFKRATATDFRSRHVLEMSDGSDLLKVNESGEIKFGAVSGKELAAYKIASYARGYRLSFQALVNDDLAALSDTGAKLTTGARNWFAGFLVDTIIANPKLSDNLGVFHASHGNLAGSAGNPSDVTIAAAKLAMRLQKDASGNPVDSKPKFLLAPAAQEQIIDALGTSTYPRFSSEAETAARGITSIIEPRLDAKNQTTAWHLFADPAASPVFEYAELAGYEGPRVETQPGWNTLSNEFRVVWHIGAGAIDHRGAFKNAGV